MEPLNIVEFLSLVKEKTASEGAYFSKQAAVSKYLNAGYIEMAGRGQEGCLFKITELGEKILEKASEQESYRAGDNFYPVIHGAALLPKKRIHKRVKPNYPYDFMEIGDSFFVACGDPSEEALVRSSVNSANKKFGVEIGVKSFKPAMMSDPIDVPDYEYTRLFVSRKCYKNEVFGQFLIPCDGMIVHRVDLLKK